MIRVPPLTKKDDYFVKRLIIATMTLFLLLCPTVAFASTVFASKTINPVLSTQTAQAKSQSTAVIQTIRSHGSFHSFGSRSRSYGRSYGGFSSPYRRRSGFGSFGTHLFAFGSGLFLGRLFNPFGFGYGYGFGFGFFHIIFDVFIVWILYRIIRAFFRR